jgi:two-component system sensor histidine kinase UhpB
VQFWVDHLHPDDQLRVSDERGKLLDGRLDRLALEYRYLHPAAGSKWIEHLACVAARDATGRAVRTFGVVRDITERKRMQEALRESEEVSRATFEQAAVGVAHVGTDGRFLRVNGKLCAIVRYPRDELLQLTFQDITHPDDLETDLNYVRQVLSGEIQTYSMEKRYFRKDRSLVWINLTVSLVRSAEGEPRFFISVIEDITDRKRTEAALHDLGGRLIRAQEEERTRLAKELHDGLSQSLALLAVELEMFGQRPPRGRAKLDARLKEFSAQTTALAAEVRHISHGLHPTALTQLGLAVALKSHCRDVAQAHQIEVGFTTTGVSHDLTEDVALSLYRVAQEALQNVVKHSGTMKATVELTAADDTIELSITDHGRGFEVPASRASGSLGLASMGERVRFVGGEMAIESQPGQGTRIRVRVPMPQGTSDATPGR